MNFGNTLTRLGLLRFSVALIWLVLLFWLAFVGFNLPPIIWWVLAGYIPLIALPFWQASKRMGQDALLLNIVAETQLMTALLFSVEARQTL